MNGKPYELATSGVNQSTNVSNHVVTDPVVQEEAIESTVTVSARSPPQPVNDKVYEQSFGNAGFFPGQ